MIEAAVTAQLKRAELLISTIIIQIALVFTMMLNFSAAQIAFGFLFISLLPGLAIVRLLIPKVEKIEQIIFAVGVSLVFFMGTGLLINFLGPIVGISKPLGLTPILVMTSILMDAIAFYEWRTSKHRFENRAPTIETKFRKQTFLVPILFLLPLLSVIGALQVSVTNSNNFILLILPLVISVLVFLVVIYKKLPSKVYISVLFVIALTLLLQFSFFSPYLVGGDIFGEYIASSSTLQNSFWNAQALGRLDAMLSVTILPTVYSNILGISQTWIFKVIYPTIFALVPLGVYQLLKSKFEEKIAFLSVFFFMSNITFFQELAELPRQMIGELFFILLFLTIFRKDFRPSVRLTFFTIFSFGIIVSHYAMAYIFLGIIITFWIINYVNRRKSVVTFNMVALFAVILFSWYIYSASGTTFGDLVKTLSTLQQNFFSSFFSPQSRGSMTLAGIGATQTATLLHRIGQYTFNLTELLIVIGVITSFIKQKRKFFSNDFFVFSFLSLLILFACIIIPNLANTFNAERFFQVSLFFLAAFCILGGYKLLSLLSRHKLNSKYIFLILTLLVLIPTFLFQSGFIYEVTKEQSYALPMSSYRLDPSQLAYQGVLKAPEVSSAEWLFQNGNSTKEIYSDRVAVTELYYAHVINRDFLNLNATKPSGSTIYLTKYTVLENLVFTGFSTQTNLTQVIPSIDTLNTIYSSGSCIVYEVP